MARWRGRISLVFDNVAGKYVWSVEAEMEIRRYLFVGKVWTMRRSRISEACGWRGRTGVGDCRGAMLVCPAAREELAMRVGSRDRPWRGVKE
jgi:hypothetical protein